jgi:pyruvate dehydrogenase E1 component
MPEDQDPRETQEWREALDSVVEFDGVERAAYLLEQLHDEAGRHAVPVPFTANTPYINTIPVDQQPAYLGPDSAFITGQIYSANGGQYM